MFKIMLYMVMVHVEDHAVHSHAMIMLYMVMVHV